MKKMSMCTFRISLFLVLFGALTITAICGAIATAELQPIDFCPDDLYYEQVYDEMDYDAADEANASLLYDEMNTKYCEWAANGECFEYNPYFCSDYNVFLPGTYLTAETDYVMRNDEPGILTLFGLWKTSENTTEIVPDADIDLRIFENGTSNVRLHKTIKTGADGQALFEWLWGSSKNDWDKEWVLEYSHEDTVGETSFYSEVKNTTDFMNDTTMLDEYPNTILY